MKKGIALLLALCMMASLAACGGGKETVETGSEQTTAGGSETEATVSSPVSESGESDIVDVVNVAISADPQDLSPWASNTSGRIQVMESIYQKLIARDGFGGDMIGNMMKDYTQVDEYTYDLELYDYIYDTEGNHLTASDVAFSYNKAIELGNSTKLGVIDSVEAVEDYVVRFVFKDMPLGNLEAIWSEIFIVTEAAYEASGDGMVSNPVGTGQYKVTDYISGSSLTLEKTNNYWQTDESLIPYVYEANAEKIVFQVITESAQRTIAMQTKAVDICSSISADDISKFAEGGEYSDGISIDAKLDNRAKYLLFNCSEDSPCNDVRVRQAICYALDVPAIVEGAYGDQAVPLVTFGNSNYSDYNPEWETDGYYEYNPEKAKELLADAGMENLELNLIIGTGSDNLCVLLQAYLAEVGIDLKLTILEEAQVNEIRNSTDGWDIYSGGTGSTDYIVNLWQVVFDPDTWSRGSMNFVDDDTLYEMLATARSAEGHTQDNVDAVHQYLEDEAYVYGIYSSVASFVHTDKVTSVVIDAKGFAIPGACTYKAE